MLVSSHAGLVDWRLSTFIWLRQPFHHLRFTLRLTQSWYLLRKSQHCIGLIPWFWPWDIVVLPFFLFLQVSPHPHWRCGMSMAIQCKTWFLVLPKRPTTRIPHKATKVCEKLFEKTSFGVNSCGGWLICIFNLVYSVVALSAAGGHVLWRKVMPAPVIYIQSGLQYPSQPSPVVLLISRSMITAINGTTGEESNPAANPIHTS